MKVCNEEPASIYLRIKFYFGVPVRRPNLITVQI